MARPDSRSGSGSTVDLKHAQDPLVLAVDVGSTATRAALYDSRARPVGGRVKVAHAFTAAADGTSQIDADRVCAEVGSAVDRLTGGRVAGRVGAVALDTFASSLVGVGADGGALTPCYTYADSRCAAYLPVLRERLDEADLQQRTGTRLHPSYLPARLLWLAETQPQVVRRVRRWLSLGEYVQLRLLGTTAASTPGAAWSGLLDRHSGRWDAVVLAACGVDPALLPAIQDPGVPLADSGPAGRRWRALRGVPWFPAVPDGLSSNLGTGADDETAIGVAAATSGAMRVLVPGSPERIPSGLWCYRADATRSLLGGAVNDVGRMVAWLQATLRLPDDDAALDAVLAAPHDVATVLVVPFLTGERSTGWAGHARAVFADVGAATTPEGIFRGAMAGVALSYARVAEQLRAEATAATRIVASGRITQALPHLLQMVADAIGTPVEHVQAKRATLRGTAIGALAAIAPAVPRDPVPLAGSYSPRADQARAYAELGARFEAMYAVSIGAAPA